LRVKRAVDPKRREKK
jgi:hypothetical protein